MTNTFWCFSGSQCRI